MTSSTALRALLAVRPQLSAVVRAGSALGLERYELLHAGPPLLNPCQPPRPLRSSIVMTCLHEGWVDSEAQAESLISNGILRLRPAQSLVCATPLFAVIAAGTPLFEVRDEAGGHISSYAPVGAVRGVDTRMGARDPGLIERLRHRDAQIAPALRHLLDQTGPIALWPLAIAGLVRGDDLHSRTTGANDALVALVRAQGNAALADDIGATPLFFLTLCMAAAQLVLRAAEGGDLPSLITRAGGNGEQFGVALAKEPDIWITCAAASPQGPRLPHLAADVAVSGAAGDSALIDFLGFGGQRLAHAPEPFNALQPFLPLPQQVPHSRDLLMAAQPILPDAWPLGIDADRLWANDLSPIVMLAMVAADGLTGLVGRGIYQPPASLFGAATDPGQT